MTFDVTRVTDVDYKGQVDINSIEELKLFMEFNESDVIIFRPTEDDPNYELCIYDIDEWK